MESRKIKREHFYTKQSRMLRNGRNMMASHTKKPAGAQAHRSLRCDCISQTLEAYPEQNHLEHSLKRLRNFMEGNMSVQLPLACERKAARLRTSGAPSKERNTNRQ